MGVAWRQATEAEAKALASALRLRLLRVCLEHPLTNREIAQRLGVNPGTALQEVTLVPDGCEVAASRLALRLTDQEYDELLGRFTALLDEFADRRSHSEGRPYSLFLAVHPDPTREITPPAADSATDPPAGTPSPH